MHRKRRIFQVAAMVLLCAGASCQAYHRHKPLARESVIAAPGIYESPEVRLLAIRHQNSLNAIYSGIRERFGPSKLEFFLISGICFRTFQLKSTNGTYLSINTKSSARFKGGNTTFEERAASVFADYSKPLLTIAASETALLEDGDVSGIIIGTRWGVERSIQDKYRYATYEEMILVVQKQQIHDFMSAALTDQQLLDRSTVIALSESESPREVTITLE
jgi:hypothetical protein